jgi:hypothetical protein
VNGWVVHVIHAQPLSSPAPFGKLSLPAEKGLWQAGVNGIYLFLKRLTLPTPNPEEPKNLILWYFFFL